MPPAPLPPDEAKRLLALRSYEILDTEAEEAFDRIVTLAADLTGNPIALVSLVDEARQWFKAGVGLPVRETHRDHAFCAHAILSPREAMVVTDAVQDPRLCDNPLVTGEPGLRSYLGVPLVDSDGFALGTLCVLDTVAKAPGDGAVALLRTLAQAVVANLELHRALRRSEAMALTDEVTGLPNRRGIAATLGRAMQERQAVTVIVIDLDHFKEANDSAGHAAGDAVLREVAQRLRQGVRGGDVVGRIGGDEFAVLLMGLADRAAATEAVRRLSAVLHKPVAHAGMSLRLGATIGAAMAPADADGAEAALRLADEAMVQAKRLGRGGIGWACRADAERVHRVTAIIRAFDADLGGATVLSGATVHLQPILRLDGTQATVAVEALARWADPELGAVPPAQLFPAIGPARAARLGEVVRDQALAAMAVLRGSGLTGARLAINLSAAEVARADIVEHIVAQVERGGLGLDAIEVEITEEVLLDRVSNRTLDQLAALRGRGAKLALDDFGTGHSGLAQLLRLPLDAVKLDKRFVQKLGTDRRAEEIIRATVSLAHGLGMVVVAEGVETAQQAAMATALGCDRAQGYFFAAPMDRQALSAWLMDRQPDAPGAPVPLRPRGQRAAG
ncbi:EAL domain-containing protein [Roseomonas stagni]|uniref:EAL domain-containing protein n=1 Tax=Falsiroseomonas algicola TaxID=2716930 RepID=A0A6M1LT55_9PROT|nr:EAL domain-containing protein [Falsiroseomonas algicola]NGM23307.1 EAL domain-containing protein [Falsiroseomonas algicola]